MNGLLGVLVALLWGTACFCSVARALKKAHFSNAPRLVNAIASGGSVALVIGILAVAVSLGTQFLLNSVHFFWPSTGEVNVALSLIWVMFIYAILKAIICGLMAGVGALFGREVGDVIAYLCVGVMCIPVLFFVPLIGG